jgi:Ca2+-binding EF-hand superfamily protein
MVEDKAKAAEEAKR